MIPKQDRQGVRQARDIEQKYDLNKDYSAIEKIANDAKTAAAAANTKATSALSVANKASEDLDALSKQDRVITFNGRTGTVVAQNGDYTAAMVGAAPSGYGLGGIAPVISDFNSAILNGWYSGGGSAINGPDKITYSSYGMVHVIAIGREVVQNYYMVSNASNPHMMATRFSYDYGATWSEWEYVNPAMALGVEYRTTERWQGKAVYTKLVNCGALPNATLKQVAHGASVVQMIRCVGQSTSVYKDSLPFWYSDTDYCTIYASTDKIYIRSGTDLSARTATAQIWYTKD